jgi:DNA-binding transcriptional LysR family regulator/class 3 adenylate cyclase
LTADRVERRLAAILAADVAGYSRLMGADEEGTLARLNAVRKVFVDPTIAAHRGRIVKTTGDGMLIEFASAVDAVRGAVAVQRGMADQNASVAKDQRIRFRIGIHVGDIIAEGDDIFGDGVNVAARLEGIAEPGGICISSSAYDQVRENVPVEFTDLGEQTLKNIYRPIRAYAVGLNYQAGRTVPTSSAAPRSSLAVPTFDWNDITYFLAVARHGSTTAVAKALNLDQATIHRRLDDFEKQIGRPIVIRQAAGYDLTDFGRELLPLATQVEEAVNSLKRFVMASHDIATGSVRVTCSESIGYRLMQSSLLDTFHDRHPGLRIELIMSDHFLDIAKGEADVAIRAGIPEEEILLGRKIADVPWALYCSRSYLDRHGRVERTEDLDSHAIVEFDGDIRDHHAARWLRSMAPNAKIVARSNTVPGLMMTVRSGAGLAPLPMPLAGRDPDLLCMLGPLPGLYSPIYMLTHPDLRNTPRVRTFFDFILAEIDIVRPVLTGGN